MCTDCPRYLLPHLLLRVNGIPKRGKYQKVPSRKKEAFFITPWHEAPNHVGAEAAQRAGPHGPQEERRLSWLSEVGGNYV